MKLKLLAIVACVGGMVGCKTQTSTPPLVCNVLFQAVTAAAQGVAGALGCTNVPAVAATLSQPLQNLNLCAKTSTSGLIGNLVCGQVANAVMGIGLSTLPAEWKCTGGNLGAQAKDVITKQCEAAVPF